MKKFILIISVSLLIHFLNKYVLENEEVLLVYLSEKLNAKQIENFFSFQKKWQWFSYSIIPLLLLIKTALISSVLYIGTFFYSKAKVTFKQLFNAVVKAEFVFLGVGILKIVWFYFFQTNYTLEDLQYFYPLSALNIVGYKGLESWLIYPLQTLNLIEFGYIIYLSYQIGFLTKTNADNGFKIMMYSYVPTLLLWVCVVMFLTLSMS